MSDWPRSSTCELVISGGDMELSRDLKDFLRLLVAHDVQFMLVGAHAIAFHAFPRNTGDIDFWVRRNRIDILTFLTGLDFDDCMSRSVSATYEGISVKVIGLNDLIANKKAAGRPKDLLDVEEFRRRGFVQD